MFQKRKGNCANTAFTEQKISFHYYSSKEPQNYVEDSISTPLP
jgi:hypothetical protein